MKLNVNDLVAKGWVKKKTYTDGPYKGLSVLKYTRKVFYDNLWKQDERLLECRGTVVDEEDNVIVLPFKKVFNLGENGISVDPDRQVYIARKVNGFMLATTYTEKYGLIVSTTGTLDSDFVELGRKWVSTLTNAVNYPGATLLYEVCDSYDPHIVPEDEGIYLIGVRLASGILMPEPFLDGYSKILGTKRPESKSIKFGEVDTNVPHEGWMISDYFSGEHLCKIKSPYYLSKKAIMRLGSSKVDEMFENPSKFKQRLDEEFFECLDWIVETFDKEEWKGYSDQQRRKHLEEYFNE